MLKILEPYSQIANYPFQYFRFCLTSNKAYVRFWGIHKRTLSNKWVITHHSFLMRKEFNTFEDAQKALDEELLFSGFKLLNNKEEVDKYRALL